MNTYSNRYPFVVATALHMDCSGGYVYTQAADVLDMLETIPATTLAMAEGELAKLTGEQMEWLALGGPHTELPMPNGTYNADALRNAECVLEALYNA